MSRIYEAIRRAVNRGELRETADGTRVVAGDALTHFVAGDDSTSTAPYIGVETAPILNAEALVPLVRALPVAVTVARDDSRDDIRVLDVIAVLWSRWKLMAAVVATALIAAAAYNSQATPIYQVRASLLVDPESLQVVPFQPVTGDTSRFDYYVTQLEVLRSRGLASKTLEHLHLLSEDATLQSNQIGQLLGSLTVAPTKSDQGVSRVINLTLTSKSPELAARLVNGHAQTYVDQNLETRRQGSREASQWLNERLGELRAQVNANEGSLQRYREREDAVSLDDRQNIVVQKLAQLNTAVTTARTERMEKEGLYQQLTAIQKSGAPLDTFPAILVNNFIQGLKADLAALQREREQLTERVGELHPDMIKVTTAIESAERRLNAEMAKVVEGVNNDYKAARARENGLLAALEDQKREVLDLNQKSIGYGALQRDATSAQQIFESVLQRVKETELSGQLQSNNARILDAAEVPQRPIWPRTQLNLILALFGGSVAAVGLVIGLEYMNPRIVKQEDVEALGVPLLGVAPRVKALKKGPLCLDRLPPEFQEALRDIRTSILLSPNAAAARTLAVTSTNIGEGKTVLASSLAASMAMAGRRVLLIDADTRRPQLSRIFNVFPSPGLSDILTGDIDADAVVCESTIKGLFLVPAGSNVANPSELLQSQSLCQLIQRFSQIYDLIVLDCPPVMAVADASIVANAASSVLFVVGSGLTSRKVAQAAIARLTSVQAQVIGVVLNKAKIDRRSEYHYPHNGFIRLDSSRS